MAPRIIPPLSRIIVWSRQRWPYSTYERVYTKPSLAYTVRRRDPELVGPASLTPREAKPLSDLDASDILRRQMSFSFFYRGRGGEDSVHPAGVIRRALGEALVHYYPLAGRLREVEGGKLVVDCTGEGVVFVQADAEVQLADLEAAGPGLRPPFPSWDQLLLDVEGSSGVTNTPLLLVQVTRFLCGGFVLALRFSHVMCDAIGISQFMNGVGELARGLPSMTVTPIWSRELIKARRRSPCPCPGLDLLPPLPPPPPPDMVARSFTFGASDVAKMKKSLRVTATTFETLAAVVWRARMAALQLPPGQDAPARLSFPVNIRGVFSLPAGYYGNAFVGSMALADCGALCRGSWADAVALVRLAKAAVTKEQDLGSMVDQILLLSRGMPIPANSFSLSDARRVGLDGVDLGWGQPVFAGPTEPLNSEWSYLIAVKDRDGEDAVCVPVVLPRRAMLRFASEVDKALQA